MNAWVPDAKRVAIIGALLAIFVSALAFTVEGGVREIS